MGMRSKPLINHYEHNGHYETPGKKYFYGSCPRVVSGWVVRFLFLLVIVVHVVARLLF